LCAPGDQVDVGLAGANLLELAMMRKADLSGEGDEGRPGRIIVRDPSPTGDEVLDAALEILIARQGSKPSAVIKPIGRNLRRTLYGRLADAGVLRAEQGRTLGVFPARRWPAQDAAHEAEVHRMVTQALVQPTTPDTRTAALIALIHALKCEHKIVDPRPYGLSRRQLRERAAEIAKGNWASEAVRKVIEEMIAAVVAATSAAASAGTG
jgi:hypothetical protein